MRSIITVLIIVVAGCGGRGSTPKKANGGNGEQCYPNGTCDDGFVCEGDVCRVDDGSNNANNANNVNNENNTPASCGNGVLQAGELCDGPDLADQTCETQGFESGTLACRANCTFDYAGCASNTSSCGNAIIDTGEVCDGANVNGQTCASVGGGQGTLGCGPNCDTFETSGCANTFCGNNTTEPGEICDGADLTGASCQTLGYDTGELRCLAGCNGYDESLCQSASCNNDVLEPGEVCDTNQLNGATCVDLGFMGGQLGCNDTCDGYDSSGCSNTPFSCSSAGVSRDECTMGSEVACTCVGCVNDGVCEPTQDDCVCPDCVNDSTCVQPIFNVPTCNNNRALRSMDRAVRLCGLRDSSTMPVVY